MAHTSRRDTVTVEFEVGKARLQRSFRNNDRQLEILDSLMAGLTHAGTRYKNLDITIIGGASPEGDTKLNNRLSRERALSILDYIRATAPEAADSAVTVPVGRDWRSVRYFAGLDAGLPMRDETIAMLDGIVSDAGSHGSDADHDTYMLRLRSLGDGTPYRHLLARVFPRVRATRLVIDVVPATWLPPVADHALPDVNVALTAELPPAPAPVARPEPEEVDCITPTLLWVKSNAIGWGLGVANLAVEYELSERWSVAAGVYYSALNYFKQTTKLRTLAIRPEVRWWLRPGECGMPRHGLWLEAHAGMAYYNIALPGGSLRFQDHKGHTPAMGGGIGAGYRVMLGAERRWCLELAAGGGVYRLRYDKFENVSAIPTGRKVGERTKVALLIDNVSVSVGYCFDVTRTRKGGGR